VKVVSQSFREAADKIISIQIPGVNIMECQRMAGEWCMLLKVRVTSPEVLTLLLDEILRIPDIKETSTTFILSTIYEDGIKGV
jgi:Lrp/AsnC family leucine-responsive transcriptional regulator